MTFPELFDYLKRSKQMWWQHWKLYLIRSSKNVSNSGSSLS